jgi:hypothetical protein
MGGPVEFDKRGEGENCSLFAVSKNKVKLPTPNRKVSRNTQADLAEVGPELEKAEPGFWMEAEDVAECREAKRGILQPVVLSPARKKHFTSAQRAKAMLGASNVRRSPSLLLSHSLLSSPNHPKLNLHMLLHPTHSLMRYPCSTIPTP